MNGWIILDKPSGMNSRRAGAICARIFGAKTFGHIGTLDPMASGLLPIALGNATRMIPFMDGTDGVKEYFFGIQFGIETDTLDITGRITNKTNVIPDENALRDSLAQFIGEISQIPPNYSAVHIDGRRAHKMARANIDFALPARSVKIYELEFLQRLGDSWQFRVVCSPGTYVRSIARDIAKISGTLGVADSIRRTQTNGFFIKDTVKLDFLENLFNNGDDFGKYLKPIDFRLGDIPVCNLTNMDAGLYKNGGFIGMTGQFKSGFVRVYADKKLIGIGNISDGILCPKRTINEQ